MKNRYLNNAIRAGVTALLLAAASTPLAAYINIDLPGATEFEGWENLNIATFGGTYPDAIGEANNAWPEPIGSNVAGSAGNASFMKLSGGGYFSSQTIYSFMTPGTFSMTNNAALDGLATVVFQLELVGELSSGPVLNYNGGSQALASTIELASSGTTATSFGDSTLLLFQWDLSSISGISSYEIVYTGAEHLAQVGLQLNSGNTFAAVPEPSTYAAMLGGACLLGTLIVRHRRRTA